MASYYHYHSLTLDASWQDTEFLSKMIAAFEKNGYDQIVVSKEADGTILIRYRFACDTPKGRKTYTTGWWDKRKLLTEITVKYRSFTSEHYPFPG